MKKRSTELANSSKLNAKDRKLNKEKPLGPYGPRGFSLPPRRVEGLDRHTFWGATEMHEAENREN